MRTEMITLTEEKPKKKTGKIDHEFVASFVRGLEDAKNGRVRRVA